jgi:hypothetical protein
MSCPITLRDQLINSDDGGTWIYLGYSSTYPSVPGSGGSTVPSLDDDNPIIDFETYIAGYYYFEYTVTDGECTESRIIVIRVQEGGEAGEGENTAICVTLHDSIDLFDYLTGNTTNGTWSVNPSSPNNPIGALSGSIFDLTGVAAGVYIFDYNITLTPEDDFVLSDCEDCFSLASVVIELQEECIAGNAGSFAAPEGEFDLFDFLSGIPDINGTWVQTEGDDTITITNGYLGTIDLDGAQGCSYKFEYTCAAAEGCESSVEIEFIMQPNLEVIIAYNDNDLIAEVISNNCEDEDISYQWYILEEGLWIAIDGKTGSTLGEPEVDKEYKVEINCNGCIVDSNIILITRDCTCNNGSIGFEFDEETNCLEILPFGETCSEVDTDVIEWRVQGTGSYTTGTSVCNCDLFDFLDVTPTCNLSGSNIQIGYNTPQRCNGVIDRVYVLYGNGDQTIESGADITSTFFNVSRNNFVNLYNRSATLAIRLSLGSGVFIFQEVNFYYNGSAGSGNCSDVVITKINVPKLFKNIEARRTVTFTDSCPPVTFNDVWTADDNCSNFYVLLTRVNVGSTPSIIGEVFGCSTPLRQWYKDGNLLAGETGLFLNLDTYGLTGFYEMVATGCGCDGNASINLSNCNVSVSLSPPSSGNYTATVSGCGGSKTYEWQRLISGIWTTINTTTTTSNTNSYTPLVSGEWRIRVICASDDCIATANFTVSIACNVGVTLTYNGTLLTATASNCTGSKTYTFQRWNGTTWVTVNTQTTTNNSVNYTPTQNGDFRVLLLCEVNGCTAVALDNATVECLTVTTVTPQGGGVFTGTVSNCAGSKTWLWQRWNGSSWQTERNVTNSNASDNFTANIQALYRLQVTCTDNGCVSESQFPFSVDCNVSASISVSGNTLIAVSSGCTGTIFYSWFYRVTPGSGSWGSPVGSASTYNTSGVAGEYRLVINCGGCTAEAFITISGCSTTVSVNCGSLPLTAVVSGCSGTVTYQWQYSPSGTGWTVVGTSQTLDPTAGDGFYRVIVFCDGVCATASNTCQISGSCNVSASISEVDDKCNWSCPISDLNNGNVLITINGGTAINAVYNLNDTAGRNNLKNDLEFWLDGNNYGGTVSFQLEIYGKFGLCLNISCTKANPNSIVKAGETTWFGNCGKTCTYVYNIPAGDPATFILAEWKFACLSNAPYAKNFISQASEIEDDWETSLSNAGYTGTVTVNTTDRTITVVTNAGLGAVSCGVPGDPTNNVSPSQSSCSAPTYIFPTLTLTLTNCSGTTLIQWQRLIGSTWTLVQTGGTTYGTCIAGSYRAIGSCGDCPFTSNTIVI